MKRAGSLRLLFVTPGDRPAGQTLALVEQVVEGGASAVLLRERQLAAGEREAFYAAAVASCRRLGALALVSREATLAARLGADGVHVGYGGPSVDEARQLAPGLLVGHSAHWPLDAPAALADYITLSPFRATPSSLPRPLLTAEQIDAVLGDPRIGPVVALGGLTAADVADLPDGLAGVAVLRALANARDPRGAAAVLRSVADARWSLGVPG